MLCVCVCVCVLQPQPQAPRSFQHTHEKYSFVPRLNIPSFSTPAACCCCRLKGWEREWAWGQSKFKKKKTCYIEELRMCYIIYHASKITVLTISAVHTVSARAEAFK